MGPHYLDPFGHRQEASDHPESQKGNRGITGYLTVLKFVVYSTCSLAVYHIHIVHIIAHTHIHVYYIIYIYILIINVLCRI